MTITYLDSIIGFAWIARIGQYRIHTICNVAASCNIVVGESLFGFPGVCYQHNRYIVFHGNLLQSMNKSGLSLIQIVVYAHIHGGHQIVHADQLYPELTDYLFDSIRQTFHFIVHRLIVVQIRPATIPAVDFVQHWICDMISLSVTILSGPAAW